MMGSRHQPTKTRLKNNACNARSAITAASLPKRSVGRIASPSPSSPSPLPSSPSPSPSPPRAPLAPLAPSGPSGPSASSPRTPLAPITVHPGVVRSFPAAKVKREAPDDEIKEYAATAMSELLGWYGYDKVDSGCTRGLNLDHFAPPAPSRPNLLHLPRALSRSLAVPPSPRSRHSRSGSPPTSNTAGLATRDTGRPPSTSSPLSLRTGPGSPRAPESSDTAPDTPDGPGNCCSWCGRAGGGTWEQGGGSVSGGGSGSGQFCSEACFAAGRRAAFKRARTCDWCRHIRHSVSYVDFQDGESQLQFCSDKCLNQYKMNIFCRETQAHLELHGLAGAGGPSTNGGGAGGAGTSGSLITPELWLRDCRSPPLSPKGLSPVAGDDADADAVEYYEEDEDDERRERLASPSIEGIGEEEGTAAPGLQDEGTRGVLAEEEGKGEEGEEVGKENGEDEDEDEEDEVEEEREREAIRETIKESLRDMDLCGDLSRTRGLPAIIAGERPPSSSTILPLFRATRQRARDHTVADILARDSHGSVYNPTTTTCRDQTASREGTIHIKDVRELRSREPAVPQSRGRRSIRYGRPRRVPRSPPWARRESIQLPTAPTNNRTTSSPGNLLPKPQTQSQPQPPLRFGQLSNRGIYPAPGMTRLPPPPVMLPSNQTPYSLNPPSLQLPLQPPQQPSIANPSLLPPVTVLVPYPIPIPIPVPIPIPIPIPLFGKYPPPDKLPGSPLPEDLSAHRGTCPIRPDPAVDRVSTVTATTTVPAATTTMTTITRGCTSRTRGRARALSNNSNNSNNSNETTAGRSSPPLVVHLSQLSHLPQRTARALQRKRRRDVTENVATDDAGDIELKTSSNNFVPA